MESTRSMPGAMKAGLAILIAAVLVAGAWFFRQDRGAMLILAAGTLAVLLMLLAYGLFLRWSRKRRAAPFERSILANTASSPYHVSEPARRAALDDLKRKFEAGLSKFRAAGKDLYSLPWYVLVGEPGGGKTEAIRHCNVGFPPGLQDYTQGAGGTINMNWWFTNHAIILDTAGRMMFEEVAPGTTSEWEQLLRLLSKARPNCPVNGMLLVIPIDSLIRDSADAIEKKAVQIAQQLDHIQRVLGVRFPVFVVVTKCDLINGFREFFEDLGDPQLQHQILGWSNPAPLDEPFNPELVDQHLRTVRSRLVRRRQALLLDPINTEDPAARRIDQVDAFYGFPDAFMKIAPRLRRYLEMIFVAGEWSPKPLFLRGIYFTSSMREGAALDAELAEALEVPVESLKDDGRSWERERAYFLRDLFTTKVFREKGLVTRASSTRSVQRRRTVGIMAVVLIGALALLGLTWTGARKLDDSIGQHARYWMAVNANWNDRRQDWSLVRPIEGGESYRYNGGAEINLGDSRTTLGNFFADASQRSGDRIQVPWVFKAQFLIQGDLNDKRRRAYQRLYESSVIAPIIEATRSRIRALAAADSWSPEANDALVELVRVEAQGSGAPAVGQPMLNLDPLMRFILPEEDYAGFRAEHRFALQDAMDWMYGSGADDPVRPAALGAGTDASRQILGTGVQAMSRYWGRCLEGDSPRLRDIRGVTRALARFTTAEDALWRLAQEPPRAPDAAEAYEARCAAQLAEAIAAGKAVNTAMGKLERRVSTGQSLLTLYEIEVDREIESALRWHEKLVQLLPRPGSAAAAQAPQYLVAMRRTLAENAAKIPSLRSRALPEELQDDLARLDRQHLRIIRALDGADQREYQVHLQLYEQAAAFIAPPAAGAHVAGHRQPAEGEVAAAIAKIAAVAAQPLPGADRLQRACAAATSLIQRAGQRSGTTAESPRSNAAPAGDSASSALAPPVPR